MRRAVRGLLLALGVVALIIAQRAVGEKMEDGDNLTITEADLAVVRGLPVMWSPVESGAPAIYDFAEKKLPTSTSAYRRAMRVAEVLVQLGELAPGRYEYKSTLDPKRPYGNMSYFEIDIARILGIAADGPPSADQPGARDFSDAQLRAFRVLHEQMEPVLQVFLMHARLRPGHFTRIPRVWGRWSRV